MRFLPILLALSACPKAGPTTAVDSAVVTANGRDLDVAPFLLGYPYKPVLPLWKSDRLLVDHRTEGERLESVQADWSAAPPAVNSGTVLTQVNWDTRNRWDMREHGPRRELYWLGDANNNERINVWRMPIDGGEPERITDEPYTYGLSFSPDETTLALLPRRGDGPYTTCLERLRIDGLTREEVLCDTPAASFTWHDPSWSPDARGVLTRVNVDGSRSSGNLAWIAFDKPTMKLLLDPAVTRRQARALERWLDPNTAVVVVDDNDIERVLALDVSTGQTRTLWTATDELSDVALLGSADAPRLVIVEHNPVQDTLRIVDPATGAQLSEQVLPGSSRWLGDDGEHRALIRVTSADSPMRTYLLNTQSKPALRPWLEVPAPTAKTLVHCTAERVEVPTFDIDPKTGKKRLLHAFLYAPIEAHDRAQTPVRITAFYGGDNRFNIDHQIHCAAGIATLSPAVRGGYGFGPAFTALNDGDLGGDEIVDVFEAARWLESQGFSRGKIGVYGGSHGGYATMRALTFPPGTNGHGQDRLYPLAFGVSRAGFSDIVTFWETCNIPDWVTLEAGDPKTDATKLKDRSPLQHVDLLNAPLLMVHGENDSRVPVAESRQMAAACEAQGKRCVYLEYPGMGHHIHGVANQARWYQAAFDLIFEASSD